MEKKICMSSSFQILPTYENVISKINWNGCKIYFWNKYEFKRFFFENRFLKLKKKEFFSKLCKLDNYEWKHKKIGEINPTGRFWRSWTLRCRNYAVVQIKRENNSRERQQMLTDLCEFFFFSILFPVVLSKDFLFSKTNEKGFRYKKEKLDSEFNTK